MKAVYTIDRNDVAELLYHLGADCPGAISVTPEGTGPGKRPGIFPDDYQEIPEERMTQIVAALHFNGRLLKTSGIHRPGGGTAEAGAGGS